MKTISCPIAACVALLLTASAQGQNWCPTGARWVYDTGSPWGSSWDSFYYAGDTVVDGSSAQRIDVEQLVTNSWGTDTLIQSHTTNAAITRRTADAVMLWNATSSAWDTLYWFGAEVGDQWRAPWAFQEECPVDRRFQVLETGTLEEDGVVLRKLRVQRTSTDGSLPEEEEWIAERLVGWLLLPHRLLRKHLRMLLHLDVLFGRPNRIQRRSPRVRSAPWASG